MYASIEYLLCGVPIVTTPSLGGRHVFFDEENAFVVAPEAHAVATGVDEMVRRTLAPVAIRDRALDAMRQHRERFDALVEEIATRLGGSVPRMGRLRGQFVNRMFRWETPEQVRKLARGAVS